LPCFNLPHSSVIIPDIIMVGSLLIQHIQCLSMKFLHIDTI
jgi:hypothetical protein